MPTVPQNTGFQRCFKCKGSGNNGLYRNPMMVCFTLGFSLLLKDHANCECDVCGGRGWLPVVG